MSETRKRENETSQSEATAAADSNKSVTDSQPRRKRRSGWDVPGK